MRKDVIYQKVPSQYIEAELDDELVLMNKKSGKFHALNDTGRSIWRLIDGVSSLESITDIMAKKYDIDVQTCGIEVKAFVDTIVDAGIVEPA